MAVRGQNTSYGMAIYNQEMKPLDYLYGPWEYLDQMFEEMGLEQDELEPGLTIGVIEDGQVVEYWNPVEGKGFIKKTFPSEDSGSGDGVKILDIVETFSDALKLATSDNQGYFISVKNDEVTEGLNHQSGLYLVVDDGVLDCVSTNVTYGVFPEDGEEVKTDGVAKTSDVYNLLKKSEETINEKIENLEPNVDNLLLGLDTADDTFDYTYVSEVNNVDGQIVPVHTTLDTASMLMEGSNKTDEEDFITVTGVSVGNYKPGDVIKNGTSLQEFLKELLMKRLYPDKAVVKPTITLSGIYVSDILVTKSTYTCEVGERLTSKFTKTYTTGKISTFNGLTASATTSVYEDAQCEPDESTFQVMIKRPGSSYVVTDDVDEIMTYGDYTFKSTMKFGENQNIPKTNFGEECPIDEYPSYNIAEQTITSSEIKISTKYKMWYGVKSDRSLVVSSGDELDSSKVLNGDYGDVSWFATGNIKSSVTISGQQIYVICPSEYEVLYDSKTSAGVKAVEGGTYTHELPNNSGEKSYTLYYMMNDGTYENVRIVEK